MTDKFSKYDRLVNERKSSLEDQIKSEFLTRTLGDKRIKNETTRQMIRQNIEFYKLTEIPFAVEIVVQTPRGLGHRGTIYTRKILEKTKEDTYQRYTRLNFYELSTEIGSLQNEEDKKQFYLRFLDQLQFIQSQTEIFKEDKEIGPFLRTLHVPTTEDEIKRFNHVVKKINKTKHIQEGIASRIEKYLTLSIERENAKESTVIFQQTEVKTEIGPLQTEGNKDRSQEQQAISNDPKETLDYLTDLFGLSYEVAEKYAPKVSLTEIIDLHDKLATRIEKEYITELIKENPEILVYKQTGNLGNYLKLLKQVQTRISQEPEKEDGLRKEFGIEENLPAYANLEELIELKNELYNRTENQKKEDETAENKEEEKRKLFAKYSLLHRNDSLL